MNTPDNQPTAEAVRCAEQIVCRNEDDSDPYPSIDADEARATQEAIESAALLIDSAIQKAMTKAINDCIEEAKMVEVPSTDHRAGSSDAYYVKDNIIERLEAIRDLLKPKEPEGKETR